MRPSPARSRTASAGGSWPSRTRSPTTPQDFSFTAGGGLSPASFSLDDDSDGTLSNSRTFNDVMPGSGYSLAETVPGGWDQTAATCDDGSPVSNINVAAGETVTCTFTNRKRGQIVVRHERRARRRAGLLLHGRRRPLTRQLLARRRPRPGARQHAHVQRRARRSRLLARGDRAGRLGPGERHLRRRQPGVEHRRVRRARRSPARSRTTSAGRSWSSRTPLPTTRRTSRSRPAAASRPTSFSLDDDADATLSNTRTFTDVPAGNGYSLAETVPSGWDQTSATCGDGSPVSNIDVAPGETVTCTFTNRKRGQIVVVKDAQPNDAQDFSFTAGGGLSPDELLARRRLRRRRCPTRARSRTSRRARATRCPRRCPSGWDQSSATCNDGSPVSNINVAAGETVTCTFANKRTRADRRRRWTRSQRPAGLRLHGRRRAVADQLPARRRLQPDALEHDTFSNVAAQAGYSISQTVPTGWGLDERHLQRRQPGVEHRRGSERDRHVHLREPEARVAHDRQGLAPQRRAGLLLHGRRRAQSRRASRSTTTRTPRSRTPAPSRTCRWARTPRPRRSRPAGTSQRHLQRRQPGVRDRHRCRARPSPARSRTRSAAASWRCSTTQPNDAQDFSFTAGGGLSPTSFQLDDDTDPALANTRTFDDLPAAGGYSLGADGVPAGWDARRRYL